MEMSISIHESLRLAIVNVRPLERLMISGTVGVSLIDKVFPSVRRALHFLSNESCASACALSDCQESISNWLSLIEGLSYYS